MSTGDHWKIVLEDINFFKQHCEEMGFFWNCELTDVPLTEPEEIIAKFRDVCPNFIITVELSCTGIWAIASAPAPLVKGSFRFFFNTVWS